MDGLHCVLDDNVKHEREEHDFKRVPEERFLARGLRRRRRLRHLRLRHPLAVQLHPGRFIVNRKSGGLTAAQAICLRNGTPLRKGPMTPSCRAWLNISQAIGLTTSAVTA